MKWFRWFNLGTKKVDIEKILAEQEQRLNDIQRENHLHFIGRAQRYCQDLIAHNVIDETERINKLKFIEVALKLKTRDANEH